jgi:nitrous oxide reductase
MTQIIFWTGFKGVTKEVRSLELEVEFFYFPFISQGHRGKLRISGMPAARGEKFQI